MWYNCELYIKTLKNNSMREHIVEISFRKYNKYNEGANMKKGDLLLIAAIAAIILPALIVIGNSLNKNRQYPRIAVIKQDGKVIKEIDIGNINNKGQFIVTSRYNNVITWDNGNIRFESSDCPNRICVNTGWIHSVGQTAVCAPNRVTVTIKHNSNNQIDGISQRCFKTLLSTNKNYKQVSIINVHKNK